MSADTALTDIEQALREATQPEGHGSCPWTTPIPEPRRALRAGVTREESDQGLRRLRDEDCVRLEAHAHREFLSLVEEKGALPEAEALLFLLRYVR